MLNRPPIAALPKAPHGAHAALFERAWRCEVPIGRARERATAPDHSSHERVGRDREVSVLLVEDNPADADLVRILLESSIQPSFVVRHVARLSDALPQLHAVPTDVVLLDLSLPDSRGLGTLSALTREAPEIPVIVLTGGNDEAIAAEAVRTGAQEFLGKEALSEDLLVRAIRHSIERHRLYLETMRHSEATRAAESRLRQMIVSNVDGMAVLDRRGLVLFANPAAEALFGSARGELVGTRFPFEVEAPCIEVQIAGPERDRRFVEMRSSELEWDGMAARLVSLRDVSDQRKAEEMRARLVEADRLRAIGQLAAGVAHEINNPAAFVLANQEVLARHVEQLADALGAVRRAVVQTGMRPEAAVESVIESLGLERILDECRAILSDNYAGLMRVRSIVKSLRTFSRIDEGDVTAVSIPEIVEQACTIAGNEIRTRARFLKELEDVPTIAGDASKLAQVFVNLLVNAAHAIEEGDPGTNEVSICTRVDGAYVVVSVRDTGCGIPKANLGRIFEPFFTTKSRDRGTGLGLSLSLETVRQHRGEIRVASVPGVGSTFEVVLPLDTGLTAGDATSLLRTAAKSVRPRVLVIDDEPMLLRAYRAMLSRSYDVSTAEGGEHALRILAHDRDFAAVLCDLVMPEVDGRSVYEWALTHAPELATRFVFVSGGAFTGRMRDFVDRLSNKVLEKPIPFEQLETALRDLESA